jgi:renalase
MPRIAIIGAGLAGVAAAMQLEKTGADVTVFEKSRGVSGRMSTRRSQPTGAMSATGANSQVEQWQCDHGAQYFIATDATFRAEVSRWQSLGIAAPWYPTIAVLGAREHFSPLVMPGGETTGKSAQAIELARWVGTPRMSSVVSNLASTLRRHVILETTVTALTRSVTGWQLTTLERGVIDTSFDALLLAIPAPQVCALLQTAGSATAELSALVARVTMQARWSVMLHFTEPLPVSFDAAVVDTEPLRWIARDNSKPERENIETWVLHASTKWSAENVEASKELVLTELVDSFSKWVGVPLQPIEAIAHRWRYAARTTDIHYEPVESPTSRSHWQHELRLGVCGDWMVGGSIEDAWLSGTHLAERIAFDLTSTTRHTK